MKEKTMTIRFLPRLVGVAEVERLRGQRGQPAVPRTRTNLSIMKRRTFQTMVMEQRP